MLLKFGQEKFEIYYLLLHFSKKWLDFYLIHHKMPIVVYRKQLFVSWWWFDDDDWMAKFDGNRREQRKSISSLFIGDSFYDIIKICIPQKKPHCYHGDISFKTKDKESKMKKLNKISFTIPIINPIWQKSSKYFIEQIQRSGDKVGHNIFKKKYV